MRIRRFNQIIILKKKVKIEKEKKKVLEFDKGLKREIGCYPSLEYFNLITIFCIRAENERVELARTFYIKRIHQSWL